MNIKLIRNSFGGIVGNIMEWYDFAVFGFLAPIITINFFPNDSPLLGLILTYGIFATGYMMRPLGGILFGYIGDKKGRKTALIISIFMMAIPTVLIGILPTYEQIGIYAGVLLIVLRMIQGLSVGGELIGSVSFMVEIASHKNRGFLGSLTLGGAVGGLLLGSAVVTLLEIYFGMDIMRDWGWRVPFLAGIFILGIGLWLREGMTESPAFLKINQKNNERFFKHTIMRERFKIIHLSMIVSLATVTSYIMFVWMPTYLSSIAEHRVQYALGINTISMLVLFIMIPIGGYLCDIYGQRKIMILATLAMLIFIYPIFMMLQSIDWHVVLFAQMTFAFIAGLLQGPLPSLMAEMFPVRVRYTSIGIGYNFSVALLGGTAPIVATWLVEKSENPFFVSFYIIFFAVVSLIALIIYRPNLCCDL